MKWNLYLALGGTAGAMILTPAQQAHGVYTGLSLVRFTGAPSGRVTYRVYANFTDSNDYVTFVYGSPTDGAMVIQSRNANDTAAGGAFFNSVPTNTAPGISEIWTYAPDTSPIPPNTTAAFESFCTIGIAARNEAPGGNDQTALAPNTPAWLPLVR